MKAEQYNITRLQTFDSSYFRGKSHLEEYGARNYYIFKQMCRYFKKISGVGSGNNTYLWKSKCLSDEGSNCFTTYNYSITPEWS